MTTREEIAQAQQDAEREAYWTRRARAKIAKAESEPQAPAPQRVHSKRQRKAMRAAGTQAHYLRARQGVGMIWSQRHRPARPSDQLVREAKLAAAKRAAREAERKAAAE